MNGLTPLAEGFALVGSGESLEVTAAAPASTPRRVRSSTGCTEPPAPAPAPADTAAAAAAAAAESSATATSTESASGAALTTDGRLRRRGRASHVFLSYVQHAQRLKGGQSGRLAPSPARTSSDRPAPDYLVVVPVVVVVVVVARIAVVVVVVVVFVFAIPGGSRRRPTSGPTTRPSTRPSGG